MKRLYTLALPALLALCCLAFFSGEALAAAAQKAPPWRATWDLVWKLVNFVILAFLIFKLGKNPMKEFLTGQRAKLAEEIEEMEKARGLAEAELNNIRKSTANLEADVADYENALTGVAERHRDGLMEQAKAEADAILQRGQIQAEQAIHKAKATLAAEMLEEAAVIAAEQITKVITNDDRARFLDNFTEQVSAKAV